MMIIRSKYTRRPLSHFIHYSGHEATRPRVLLLSYFQRCQLISRQSQVWLYLHRYRLGRPSSFHRGLICPLTGYRRGVGSYTALVRGLALQTAAGGSLPAWFLYTW
jgi:hypothetical protein